MTHKTTSDTQPYFTLKPVNDGTLAYAEFEHQGVVARMLPMFPGYAFTIDGRVVSFKRKQPIFLSPGTTAGGGYSNVNIGPSWMKRSQYVHIQICRAFHPNPDPAHRTQVNHLDGNPGNNAANNLEWVSPRQNLLHAHTLRKAQGREVIILSKAQKTMISKLYRMGHKMLPIAKLLDVPYDSVRRHLKVSKKKEKIVVSRKRQKMIWTLHSAGYEPRFIATLLKLSVDEVLRVLNPAKKAAA